MMMLQHLPSSVVYQHLQHDQVERHYHSRSSSPTPTPTSAEAPSVIIKRTYSVENMVTLREQRRLREEMFLEQRRWYAVKDDELSPQINLKNRAVVEFEESDRESPDQESNYHTRYESKEEEVYHIQIRDVPDETDAEGPLDLSMNKYKVQRRDRDESGTDSEDSSGGNGDDQAQGKAYKKSLMKRYCESIQLFSINYLLKYILK